LSSYKKNINTRIGRFIITCLDSFLNVG